ncbi:MAG TPA: hypothetical protein PKJ83_06285 [Cyclobacteriaceae bacterium]|nr:hypothetical protein [Cyclobacteriaceae bacterium]HRG80474.1 hypothetical protein [Cyclobacteriaceae bacterium]
MKAITKKLILIVSTVIPVFASAHPGHGHESPLSPGHYLANPEHYIPLALTIGAALLAVSIRYLFIRSKERTKK